jgi:hypothetical protein
MNAQLYTTTVGGRPRYCDKCKKQVYTVKGKFIQHPMPGNPKSNCPNSGQAVPA